MGARARSKRLAPWTGATPGRILASMHGAKQFLGFGSAGLLLAGLLAFGCSDDDADSGGAGNVCAPGHQIGCACPDGSQGAQTCLPGGDGFGACTCGQGSTTGGTCDYEGNDWCDEPNVCAAGTDRDCCEVSEDCSSKEICHPWLSDSVTKGACVDALAQRYCVYLEDYDDGTCVDQDDPFGGNAEAYWLIRVDGQVRWSSKSVSPGYVPCPYSFPGSPGISLAGNQVVFEVWEWDDPSADDLLVRACFQDSGGNCTSIPPWALREGVVPFSGGGVSFWLYFDLC